MCAAWEGSWKNPPDKRIEIAIRRQLDELVARQCKLFIYYYCWVVVFFGSHSIFVRLLFFVLARTHVGTGRHQFKWWDATFIVWLSSVGVCASVSKFRRQWDKFCVTSCCRFRVKTNSRMTSFEAILIPLDLILLFWHSRGKLPSPNGTKRQRDRDRELGSEWVHQSNCFWIDRRPNVYLLVSAYTAKDDKK